MESQDVKNMSLKQLISYCQDNSIKGYSNRKKSEIVELILKSQSSTEESSSQDTGKFRVNTKDQFYTNREVAKKCIQWTLDVIEKEGFSPDDYLWVEPSAGNGSFFDNIPKGVKKIGIDIDPKSSNIQMGNFLEWKPPNEPIIIIGNPPFGRQSSLAKSFISHSCSFANIVQSSGGRNNIIAFILPKSFTKPSMSNAFSLKFHPVFSQELEPNAFRVDNEPYDVPCVFQVWIRRETDRIKEVKIKEQGFSYVNLKKDSKADYDIVFRRVGVYAGRCYKYNQDEPYSIQSHYFLKFDKEIIQFIDKIVERINDHVFPSNTVGPRSLSKTEANTVINSIIDTLTK